MIVFLEYPQNYTITFKTTEFFIRYNLLCVKRCRYQRKSNSCTCERFDTKPAHMYTHYQNVTTNLWTVKFDIYGVQKSMCLNVCLGLHQTPKKFVINKQPSIFMPTFSNTDLNLKNKILKTVFFCQPHRHVFLGNLFANLKISFLMK